MQVAEDETLALIERFNFLRKSGVCSPTTASLLDEAERLLLQVEPSVSAGLTNLVRESYADSANTPWSSGYRVGVIAASEYIRDVYEDKRMEAGYDE